MAATRSVADLMRALGLAVDGPGRWGSVPPSRRPGIFAVEADRPTASAPMDIVAVRRWLERVPTLMVDGERPTPTILDRRLGEFWIPAEILLYVGRSDKNLGARLAAMYATELGQRRPHPGGHWLKALRDQGKLRLWWAETDAAEEYEDALLVAFAAGIPETDAVALARRTPEGNPILPWANLESPSGGKRVTGITGSLLAAEPSATDTATAGPSEPSKRATTRRRVTVTRAAVPRTTRPRAAGPVQRSARPTHLTAEGLAAVEAELAQLTSVQRPEVVARVKQARELGDLRENADYEAARNDQAFLEGRIRELEKRLRTAVVIKSNSSGTVALGSTVRFELDGTTEELTIVGSAEAAPGAGRVSGASPVGKALLGHRAGDEVVVRAPAADSRYRILEVR